MRSLVLAYAAIAITTLLSFFLPGIFGVAAAVLTLAAVAWLLTIWLGTADALLAFLAALHIILLEVFGPSALLALFGAAVVLLAVALIPLAIVGAVPRDDNLVVERVTRHKTLPYGLVATRAGTTFHRHTCPLLVRVSADARVDLADKREALEYGLTPCKACKP